MIHAQGWGHVLPPTHGGLSALEHGHTGVMAMSPGTAIHSALSWSGHGEGHLFGAGFNVTHCVLVTIHHTKCPHPLVPRSGADGETQRLFLPLQFLAQSLAWFLAGDIGSWLPAHGNCGWNGIVPVQSLWDVPAPPLRLRHLHVGAGVLEGKVSLERASPAEHKPALSHLWHRLGQGTALLFILWDEVKVQLSAICHGCGSAWGIALSLLTWEPWAAAPRSREHFVAVGTLGFRHFSLQQPWCHILGKAQLHMQGALNSRPAPRALAFP